MFDFLTKLFDTHGFPRRWDCGYAWTETPALGWLHILSDLGVWTAYIAIPCVLAYFVLRRRDIPFQIIFILFGAFILACGTTHLMEALIFWWPAYRLSGLIKLFTALVSWGTVLALVPVVPQVLSLRSPKELEREVAERQRVETDLQQLNAELERRVQERTAALAQANAELKEHARLAALRADTTAYVAQGDDLQRGLQSCAAALVRHLEVAFARVWTLDEAEQVLELQASAGLYTHRDGAHGRVKVGEFKIGRIAQERQPHLTNAVLDDPWISDPAWARREGMVAFAGYPLLAEGRLLGVLALFARQPLSERVLADLSPIADSVAQYIVRRQAAEALRESEERFRSMADSIPQLAWMARPNGDLYWYNQRWYDYTGTSFEEMEGWGWQSVHDPVELPRILEHFRAAIASGTPWEDTFPLRRHDGAMRWHLSRALPFRDEQGRIVRWFGTNTDITELRDMEAALRRAQEDLEQRVEERTAELSAANEALQREVGERKDAESKVQAFAGELQRSNQELEQFASVASHDLQEPLRKIQAFGDRLQIKCSGELGETGQDYLARMRAAALRMSTLIEDLLTFSRVGTLKQPFVAVDLTREAQQVVSDLEARLQQTQGRVEIGPLPTVMADPTQMRQLLQNLIGNALKFHQPGVPPLVQVEGRIVQRSVRGPDGKERSVSFGELTVRDNGIGFEEVYLERIFALFQRLHGRNEYEGTGIGLAICRKIVERHGGVITAHSTPGHGATFIVALPL